MKRRARKKSAPSDIVSPVLWGGSYRQKAMMKIMIKSNAMISPVLEGEWQVYYIVYARDLHAG